MIISQQQFPRFAFALHRKYLYNYWASRVNDILSSPDKPDETKPIDELKPMNIESNLLSLFQCRMSTDPGFQQHILSLISQDSELVQRTIEYLRFLRETYAFDKDRSLFGKKEETIESESGVKPKDKLKTNAYALFQHGIENAPAVLDAISAVRTREDAATVRLLKRSGCLNQTVKCNSIGIFASNGFKDPYYYQTLNLDWCRYLHQQGFLSTIEKGTYAEVLDMQEDVGSSVYNRLTKKCRVTIKISDFKERAHVNLFHSMPILYDIREEASKTFLPNDKHVDLQDIYTISEDVNNFKSFTNDFLTIASELWYLSQSEDNKLDLLHIEEPLSLKEFTTEISDYTLLQQAGNKILQKNCEDKLNHDAVREIYVFLRDCYHASPKEATEINNKLQDLDNPEKTWELPVRDFPIIVKINPVGVIEDKEPFSKHHPYGSENNYSIIFKNPSLVNPNLVSEIKKAEEEILDDCKKIASCPWNLVEEKFNNKENEISTRHTKRFGEIVSLYLISKMYLNYYWLRSSTTWFTKRLQNRVQKLPDNQAFVLNQLRCEYWLKIGKSFAQTTMKQAEKQIPDDANKDVLWEFWIRFSKAALQNQDYGTVRRCYAKLAKIDPENTYFKEERMLLDEVLKDEILINKMNLKKHSGEALHYFKEADIDSFQLFIENIKPGEIIDASLPLLNYSLGLDKYLKDTVWKGIADYIHKKNIDQNEYVHLPSYWQNVFNGINSPSLGNWAKLYSQEYKKKQDNQILFWMQEYLKNNFNEEIIKAISRAAESVREYRNNICHANQNFMSLDEFKKKRCDIIQKINKLLDVMDTLNIKK